MTPPGLGDVVPGELGQFMVALQEVHLFGALDLPSHAREKHLMRKVVALGGILRGVHELMQDHVAHGRAVEAAILDQFGEVSGVTVKIAGHHELPVVGKDEERPLAQRVVPVQVRSPEEAVDSGVCVTHNVPPKCGMSSPADGSDCCAGSVSGGRTPGIVPRTASSRAIR